MPFTVCRDDLAGLVDGTADVVEARVHYPGFFDGFDKALLRIGRNGPGGLFDGGAAGVPVLVVEEVDADRFYFRNGTDSMGGFLCG